VTPYSWSVTNGSLPEGLTLDAATGNVFGTPSLSGTYPVTIRVIDNRGVSTQRAFGLDIRDSSAPIALNITLSADNAEEVYLNGTRLGSSSSWTKASSYLDIVQPGSNVLAVKATDAGGIAGLVAQLSWLGQVTVSQRQWRVFTSEVPGWETPGFNDSAWPFATEYGRYGIGPWFKRVVGFPGNSTAQWIWSADANGDNTVYLRYRFEVGGP